MLAIGGLLTELAEAGIDSSLGMRWTHWSSFDLLYAPLLTVADNQPTAKTLTDTLLLISIVYAAWRYSEEQGRRQSLMERELLSAHEVQRVLIPTAAPARPGFSVERVYLPAQEVGGDFYQVLPGADGSLLLVVGDVSGKGLKAAMTVSAIVGALRDFEARRPGRVLEHLNRVLCRQVSGFVTCCAALVEAGGPETMANAGHLPPYCNGREMEVEAGLPLGVIGGAEYPEHRFELQANDQLTFVSDGVVEATSPQRELF